MAANIQIKVQLSLFHLREERNLLQSRLQLPIRSN